jgi:hypothetical protein
VLFNRGVYLCHQAACFRKCSNYILPYAIIGVIATNSPMTLDTHTLFSLRHLSPAADDIPQL